MSNLSLYEGLTLFFQDTVLRIWVLKSAYNYFKDMRNRYNADVKSSPTNSYENVISDQIASEDKSHQVFVDSPFCTYSGQYLASEMVAQLCCYSSRFQRLIY